MKPQSQPLNQVYSILSPNGSAEPIAAADFWKLAANPADPRNNPDMGYLVSEFAFDADWDNWEVHPNGDEFVYCLSGRATFILEAPDGLNEIPLAPGQFVIVPKNTWHTAKVEEPTRALFVTWGHGTQTRKA